MDLSLTVTKAPQRATQSVVSSGAAKRAQASNGATISNGPIINGARTAQQNMQRDSASSRASSHVNRMKQLSRGALSGGNTVGMLQPRGAQIPQQEGVGNLGSVETTAAPTAAPGTAGSNAMGPMGVFSNGGGAPQQLIRRDSASSEGSNALSDTPSTSSVLMMPIHDTKPKKMERASTWSTHVENVFRLQAAGYTDFTTYLKMWGEAAEQIPVWDESGFVKSIKNKDGLFMYFRRTRECEDKYLKKVKIYSY